MMRPGSELLPTAFDPSYKNPFLPVCEKGYLIEAVA